jgi:hypothetical protein
MNVINQLPQHYCEVDYITKILKILEEKLPENFDFYIYNNDYIPNIIKNDNIKIAIHVGNEVGWDISNYDKVDLIFRFYQSENCDFQKIFPINIGYNSSGNNEVSFLTEKDLPKRNIDVFFKGQKNHRENFFNNLRLNKYNQNIIQTDGFRQGDSIQTYVETLSNTKICLVPKGLSRETFRYTEAFASGCIVITTEKLSVWFYEKSPAYFVKNWSVVDDEFIENILNQDLKIEKEKSLQYYKEYLSPEATTNYIIKILNEKEMF